MVLLIAMYVEAHTQETMLRYGGTVDLKISEASAQASARWRLPLLILEHNGVVQRAPRNSMGSNNVNWHRVGANAVVIGNKCHFDR